MTWLALVVDVLACHRLVRIVTKDVITARPRRAVINWAYARKMGDQWDDDGTVGDLEPMVEADMREDPAGTPKLAVLVICRWCCGTWVAIGVVAAQWAVPDMWQYPATALALSSASTFLARLEAG